MSQESSYDIEIVGEGHNVQHGNDNLMVLGAGPAPRDDSEMAVDADPAPREEDSQTGPVVTPSGDSREPSPQQQSRMKVRISGKSHNIQTGQHNKLVDVRRNTLEEPSSYEEDGVPEEDYPSTTVTAVQETSGHPGADLPPNVAAMVKTAGQFTCDLPTEEETVDKSEDREINLASRPQASILSRWDQTVDKHSLSSMEDNSSAVSNADHISCDSQAGDVSHTLDDTRTNKETDNLYSTERSDDGSNSPLADHQPTNNIKPEENRFSEVQGGYTIKIGQCQTVVKMTVTPEAVAFMSRYDSLKDATQLNSTSGQRMLHCAWIEVYHEIPPVTTRWKLKCQNVMSEFYVDVLRGLYRDQFARALELVRVIYETFRVQLFSVFWGNLALEFECEHSDQESVERLEGEQEKVKQVFQQLISDCTHVGEDIQVTVTCVRSTSNKEDALSTLGHDIKGSSQSEDRVSRDIQVYDETNESGSDRARLANVEEKLQEQKTTSEKMMEMVLKLQESMDALLQRDATKLRLAVSESTNTTMENKSKVIEMERPFSDFGIERYELNISDKPLKESPEKTLERDASVQPKDGTDKFLMAYEESGNSDTTRYPSEPPVSRFQTDYQRDKPHPDDRTRSSPEPADFGAFGGRKASRVWNGDKAERFLDSLHVSSTSRLLESAGLALCLEDPPSPRARALDTVLCLDVSDSVKEEGLDQMKRIVNKFIDGVEEVAEQHGLEENVAVVTFGGQAFVAQHLTNDYSRVRDVIDKLTLGGTSPMFEALLVCAAAIQGRGGMIDVAGVHKVRPRIIFITDGKLTSGETGPDEQLPRSSTAKVACIRLVTEFSSPKNQTKIKPIAWIPVGDADENFLGSLAKLGDGMLVREDSVDKLIRYFWMHASVGRVYAVMENHADDYGDVNVAMDAMIDALVSNVHPDDKKEIIKILQGKLQNKETDDGPTDYNSVTEREVLPPLGSRVVRGPEWKWDNQDTDGPGTIINHDKNDSWIWVLWDNGMHNRYRFGEGGAYDVLTVDDQPRVLAHDELIDIGVSVTRGADWRYGDQDGGPGNVGVVIRKRKDGKVKVRWSNGHINSYRYGLDGAFDLAVCDPFDQGKKQTSKTDNTRSSPTPPTAGQSDIETRHTQLTHPGTNIVWQWKDDRGQWRLYPDDQLAKLEREYTKRPNRSCLVQRDGNSYRVRFEGMQEVHLEDKTARDVLRSAVSDEEYDTLRAVELSLQ